MCSNNQAERTAIIKALHALETIKLSNNTPPTFKIFTDSKLTLSALKTPQNRTHLIEEIRKNSCPGKTRRVHRVYMDKGPRRTQRK
jgi:ribonuclease HI